jgi:hypothetical protein
MNRHGHNQSKKTARLAVKKETIRQLRTLDEDELRAAAGGMKLTTLPSCNGC